MNESCVPHKNETTAVLLLCGVCVPHCPGLQYAVTTYLCGTVVANRYHVPSRILHSPAELRDYIRLLESIVQVSAAAVLCSRPAATVVP